MSKEIEVVDIETKKVEETKQNTQDSKQVKIQVLTLGEIVVKFEMPQNFIDEINNVFDEKEQTTVDWSTQLAGKIKKEKLKIKNNGARSPSALTKMTTGVLRGSQAF